MLEPWIILTLASALLFALKDIYAKKVMVNKGINAKELVFQRLLLMLTIVTFLFLPLVEFSTFSTLWHLYVAQSILIISAMTLYFHLLAKYEISVVAPLTNLSPIILIFFTAIFLSEKLQLIQYAGIFVLVAATYYLEVFLHHKKGEKVSLTKVFSNNKTFFILGLVMLVTISLAGVTDKTIIGKTTVYTNIFFTSLAGLIFMLIYFIKTKTVRQEFSKIMHCPGVWTVVLADGVSQMLILFAMAQPAALLSLIIPLRRTSTLFSSIFGGMLFHEAYLLPKSFAIAGMLIGLVMILL